MAVPMQMRKGEILIDDDWRDHDSLFKPRIDGEPKGRGAVPRDYSIQPMEMMAPPSDIILIPRSEWSDRIKDKIASGSQLSDIRLSGDGRGDMVPSLDQGQVGYCWAHSTTHAVMLARMIQNQPYVPLSAYSVAATIKNGRDEGGWGALSAQFATQNGIAAQSVWPQGDRNYRSHQGEDVKASFAAHKVTEDWTDLTRGVYDRNLTFDQLASLLLSNVSGPVDFNWWGHSVCALDLVEVEAGSFGIRIWNSWGDGWSDRGMGVLRGSKAIPNGAVAIRTTSASTV